MMHHLVTEKRMDKTGRVVTRHVRSSTDKAPMAAVPAPQVKSQHTAPASPRLAMSKKPTPKQLEVRNHHFSRYAYRPSSELIEVLDPSSTAHSAHKVDADEISIYRMLSIASSGDALLLMGHGVDTPEAAEQFLSENGLEHLLVDRSAFMSEAADRRIGINSLLDVNTNYGGNYPDNLVLDAAEASESKSLDKFSPYVDMPDMILRDELAFADMKKVGISKLAAVPNPDYVREKLMAIHRRETNYSIDDFANIIDSSQRQPPQYMEDLVKVADMYGGDYFSQLYQPVRAYLYIRNNKGVLDDDLKAAIDYDDAVLKGGSRLGIGEVKRLIEENVPPEDVPAMEKRGLSVDQMIATKVHGIELSVSDGWL